jgi:predicted dehydrogenase
MGKAAKDFPDAKRFVDWRTMLDERFDAATVGTPDHMHAPISLAMMQRGKHVYCEKPLTHTIYEARQMRLAAEKQNVVTQMGNQIQSHSFYRTAVKIVHEGLIGKVREVLSWQASPSGWRVADDRPKTSDPVPQTLHWNLWLGAAPERPFKKGMYHSFFWRTWQDFSSGQLGDFGCHILDPVFMALGLTAPTHIRAEAPSMNNEAWNTWAVVRYLFPKTERTVDQIPVTWFDGHGNIPPEAMHGIPRQKLPGAGSLLLGEKGTLLIPHVGAPKLFPEEQFAETKLPQEPNRNHYISWADACRGVGKTTSSFDYSGPLTETVLLGTLAIRVRGQTLHWNTQDMSISGVSFPDSTPPAHWVTKQYRQGWEPMWI